MKKTLILIVGGIVLISVVATWAYLLFFGAPESAEEVFTNFGGGGDIERERVVPGSGAPERDVVVDRNLTQLTIKPVAGFNYVQDESGGYDIYYVEQGTGHIYTIDGESGEEVRVSGTTFTQISRATIGPRGDYAILQNTNEEEPLTYLQPITTATATPSIAPNAENIGFSASGDTLYYTTSGATSTTGHTIDLNDGVRREVFTVPFRDITMIWGNRWYFYNDPAAHLRGGLFAITDGVFRAVGAPGYGLSALTTNVNGTESIVRSEIALPEGVLTSTVGGQSLAVQAIPEKCTFDTVDSTVLWCGAPVLTNTDRTFQTDWYQGTFSFNDYLWQIDVETGAATARVPFERDTGRQVDLIHPTVRDDGTALLFQNKIDRTLWQFVIGERNVASGTATTTAATSTTSSEAAIETN